MKQLVLLFVHLILLPEAREYAALLIDRLLFGRLLDLQLKMQNLGHQLSKTFWVTVICMWMPRLHNCSSFFNRQVTVRGRTRERPNDQGWATKRRNNRRYAVFATSNDFKVRRASSSLCGHSFVSLGAADYVAPIRQKKGTSLNGT